MENTSANNQNANALQVFNFKNQQVDIIIINGEPHFIGKQVATILGYSNTNDAIIKHVDADDKLTSQIAMAGQNRNVTLINEYGVYSLILGSKLPNAKRFKRWVVSEVLPSIRKTGEYKIKDDTNDQQLLLQQAVRKEGKLYRRECTDAIKQLCIYFNLVGTKEESITYGKYTNLVYRIIRVPKGMRDSFDAVTLMTIANMELIVADEIMRCLIQNLDKGQIYCAVSKRLIAYAQTAMLQERIDKTLMIKSPKL